MRKMMSKKLLSTLLLGSLVSAPLTVLAETSEMKEINSITVIGDSNIQGLSDTNTHDRDNYENPIPELLGEALDAPEVNNLGIAGSTIADGYEAMHDRVNGAPESDLVVLQGGINDWIRGVDYNEFHSALNKYYGGAKERFTNSDIVALTVTDTTWKRQVDDGVSLEQWVNAQVEVANTHQIPIIDLFHSGVFNLADSQDGLHYNQETAKSLAEYVAGQVKEKVLTRSVAPQEEVTTTQEEVNTPQGEVTTTQGEVNTTQGEVNTTQGEVTTTQGEVNTPQGEVNTPRGEVNTPQGEVTTTQEEVSTPQGEVTTTQGEVNTTQGEVNTPQGEVTTIQEDTTIQNTSVEKQTSNNKIISTGFEVYGLMVTMILSVFGMVLVSIEVD